MRSWKITQQLFREFCTASTNVHLIHEKFFGSKYPNWQPWSDSVPSIEPARIWSIPQTFPEMYKIVRSKVTWMLHIGNYSQHTEHPEEQSRKPTSANDHQQTSERATDHRRTLVRATDHQLTSVTATNHQQTSVGAIDHQQTSVGVTNHELPSVKVVRCTIRMKGRPGMTTDQ